MEVRGRLEACNDGRRRMMARQEDYTEGLGERR